MKQKLKLLMALGSIALLLIGCASKTPKFNPSNKGIVFEKGKPYAIPYESTYYYIAKSNLDAIHKIAASNNKSKAPNKEIAEWADILYRGSNIAKRQCKLGDVMWVEGSVVKRARNKNDKLTEILLTLAAFTTGQAGCVKPLSKQEYQYRQKQQMIASEIQRQQKAKKTAEMKEVFNTMGQIGTQLQQMNGGMANGYQNYGLKSSSSGCSSDFDCGLGQSCVKPQYSSTGTCMKSVNSSGIPQFNSHQNNVGPNMNKQCTFNTDCPIGFSCSGGNCIK